MARYNTDGTLDANFSGDGKLTVDFGGDNAFATALGMQPDGKIVVAGVTGSSSGSDFALARYFPDGSLDATFDSDGKVITDFGGTPDGANALAIQPDGRIVVAGHSDHLNSSGGFYGDFALARYHAVTDPTAPTVASLTPPTTRSGNIPVQSSESMDPKSLMQNSADPTQLSPSATIKLFVGDSTSTIEVPAKVRCTDTSCRTVVLDPDVRLGKRKMYTVRIERAGDTDSLAVKDLVGNELAADYVSSFKTKRR